MTEFFQRLFTLIGFGEYTTGVVLVGCGLLGLSAGAIGPFALLRKRALMADAASHAMWPGVTLAFVVMVVLGGTGRWMPGLLFGALVSGLLGMLCVLAITHWSRVRQDAALAIVLSVFYGFGVVVYGFIQGLPQGSQAGLQHFIFGRITGMQAADTFVIVGMCGLTLAMVWLLFKEFKVLCFDEDFAAAQGWPTGGIDVIMMALLVIVTVVGIQAVGLVLMVAMLITPAVAARFWTDDLGRMVWLSSGIGLVSCVTGAVLSDRMHDLPAGAVMVLTATGLFLVSLFLGHRGGLLTRFLRRAGLQRSVGREHLLRAIFEHNEREGERPTRGDLLASRAWGAADMRRHLGRALREELVFEDARGRVSLTETGSAEAARLVRNHRLWELYLIQHADIAPSHVDRDADQIEHLLGPSMVAKLERMLEEAYPAQAVPLSPHLVAPDDHKKG